MAFKHLLNVLIADSFRNIYMYMRAQPGSYTRRKMPWFLRILLGFVALVVNILLTPLKFIAALIGAPFRAISELHLVCAITEADRLRKQRMAASDIANRKGTPATPITEEPSPLGTTPSPGVLDEPPELIDILLYPDEGLKRVAVLVEADKINCPEVQLVMARMIATAKATKACIALAATQLDLPTPYAIIVLKHIDKEDPKEPYCLINPEIIAHNEPTVKMSEGCMSVSRGCRDVSVPRYREVTVKAIDSTGKEVLIRAIGDKAHILQHEIDHLEGKINLDLLPPTERHTIDTVLKTTYSFKVTR